MASLRTLGLAVVAILLAGRPSAADTWDVPHPISAGAGEAFQLRKVLDEAAAMPVGRVRTRTTHAWTDRSREVLVEFDGALTPKGQDEKGGARVSLGVELGHVGIDHEEHAPAIRASGVQVSVESVLDAKGLVRSGTAVGADGLGAVGQFLKPAASWLLPFTPAEKVRVGDAWDVPIEYFLWSIGQLGDARATGFVRQMLVAVEVREGARCAKVRTFVSLERKQPPGMTPPGVGIGEGAATARFRARGTTWIGLDGCLREDVLDVRMNIENDATKVGLDWIHHRETTAQPQALGALPRAWTRLTAGRPFVHGYEAGLVEGRFVGRALACFVARYGDADAEALAAGVFGDPDHYEMIAGYVPVLVDAEDPGSFPDPEMAALGPGLFFRDLEGETIFTIVASAMPPELLSVVLEAPKERTPKARPSDAYQALEVQAQALRDATASGRVTAALAAIRTIGAAPGGVRIQQEARAAERALASAGEERIDDLRTQGAAKKTRAAALAGLDALATEYAGHAIERQARAEIAALRKRK